MIHKRYFYNSLDRLKQNTYGFRSSNVNLAYDYLKSREKQSQDERGYSELAQKRYYKTLNKVFTYLLNILKWFNPYELKDLTQENIYKVYTDLEQDKLTSITGKILEENSKKDIYSKELKNGFFEFIEKSHIARKVIKRIYREYKVVSYFTYDDIVRMSNATKRKDYELLLWLMFDTGIEINTILQLEKKHFLKKENYWYLNVPLDISKASRQPRNILIYQNSTIDLLNSTLPSLNDNDKLFKFGYRNANKLIKAVSEKTNTKTKPNKEIVKPHDFRRSMTMFFVNIEWNKIDILARLGQKPSSTEIDHYFNASGIDQERLVKKKEIAENIDNKSKIDNLEKELRQKTIEIEGLQGLYKDLFSKIPKTTDLEINDYGLLSQMLKTKDGQKFRIRKGKKVKEFLVKEYSDKRVKDDSNLKFSTSDPLYYKK